MIESIYYHEKIRKRKNKGKIFLVVIIFILIIGGLIYLIDFSPAFKVKEIKINGVEQLDDNEIIAQLKNFVTNQSRITKILGPDNILSWPRDYSEFTKNYPIFEKFDIKKSFLEHTIVVDVKEREKFGVWCLQAPLNTNNTQINIEEILPKSASSSSELVSCWWFDKNGFVFGEAPYAEGFLISKVNDFSGRILKAGDLVLTNDFFQNFLNIHQLLEKIGLTINDLSLYNLSSEEIVLEETSNNPKIYFSLRFNPLDTVSALNKLKDEPGFGKLLYIDLRTENRVYYKLK